jgi:ABC-2 type transport system ATP-binding protein
VLAVETVGLSYAFGRAPVLRDVQLAVPAGSIYGFLGPNGAGKTTTLRLLLGLLRRQHGTIRVLGMDLDRRRTDVLARTGSLIETPSLYGQLTAAENLRVWQVVYGCPRSRIAEVLQLVGLADTGKKRAAQFSLGMRQRLGVAIALLASPDLLVLDEPTNGLDPHGIVEMRELLRRLNRDTGVTVLVSSHLLSEVERLVTHVGIIKAGTLVFQGPLQTLIDRAEAEQRLVVVRPDLEAIYMDLLRD